MKHIQKIIYLEDFISRMPSIVPAFYDNSYCITFNKMPNKDDDGRYLPSSNYGLFPLSIKWEYGDTFKGKVISFKTLCKWYHALENYIHLLSVDKCGLMHYGAAIEYYKYENNSKYSMDSCIELDNFIKEICGEKNENLYNEASTIYEKLTQKYFPKFIIDNNLQDVWKCKWLTVADVVKWIGWFEAMSIKYGQLTNVNECSNADNCCECEKFFRLGGVNMLTKLKQFIDSIKPINISDCFQPTIVIPIKLNASYNDLGEMSIMCEEWEGGKDYKSYNINKQDGAVVAHNNMDWKFSLNETEPTTDANGYYYSDIFKENYFASVPGMTLEEKNKFNEDPNISGENTPLPQFNRLIEQSAYDTVEAFNGLVTEDLHYTYDYLNQLYLFSGNVTPNVIKNVSFKTNINTSDYGYCVFKGIIYEVILGSYITYNKNNYLVKYDTDGNPYIDVNGIIRYGLLERDANATPSTWKLTFNLGDIILYPNEAKLGIEIDGIFYLQNNNNQFSLNGKLYSKVTKYADIYGDIIYLNEDNFIVSPILNGNTINYIKNNNILGEYVLSPTQDSDGYLVDDSYLYVIKPMTIYDSNKITGYTESKLSSFISNMDFVYDNIGNKLPGLFKKTSDEEYVEPTEGTLLELPYKAMTPIRLTNIYNDNTITDNFWGDYLDTIVLYYADLNNQPITKKINLTSNLSLQDVIDELTLELEEKQNQGKLMCEFTYYMGCTLSIKHNNDNSLQIDILENGVKYIDKVELTKKSFKYYLDDYNFYNLYYYDLIYDKLSYYNDTYNFNSSVPKSTFTIQITSFFTNNNNKLVFSNDNGWVDFPVFREEYKIGNSSLKNVEENIYIDRGISRAIDYHIKLMEVNSLESLEQYGNGFFKIISN